MPPTVVVAAPFPIADNRLIRNGNVMTSTRVERWPSATENVFGRFVRYTDGNSHAEGKAYVVP